MTADEIVERLQGRRTPGGWQARCPAHQDQNASLSIKAGEDGRVLLKCFAGCKFQEIVAAMGLTQADMFPPKPELRRRVEDRIVAHYDYTDAAGKLLFQVLRFEPKDFRQRRPDPERPGKWLWNMIGVTRVLYRLPAMLAAKAVGRTLFLVEGEKDAEALATLGLVATCNPGGACKWESSYSEVLAGAKVIVLPDRDLPGRRHAALVLRELTGKAESVRVVDLPDRGGHTVKDAADWVAADGTTAELRQIVNSAPPWVPPAEEATALPTAAILAAGNPVVSLPQGAQSISTASRKLGTLLASTGQFFMRGRAVVKLTLDEQRAPRMEDIPPATLASDFEGVAELTSMKSGVSGPATCSEQTAKMIAASIAFRDVMLPLRTVTHCPVLIERDGRLIEVVGYDRLSGIYAAGQHAAAMNVAEARLLLNELLDGFRFATPADRARALAALVTPALLFGGLLKGRAPIDLGEADESQTGKGFRNKLTAAIYSQHVTTLTQQKSGVGSMEEGFNMALIRGANIIAFDNVRGKIDSPSIESFLTEDHYFARAPFMQHVEIDPVCVVIMMTSNRADLSTDLANRSSCVSMKKQPEGHVFRLFPEGDVLEHVRANQALYLGAVFAIVRAWFAAGKLRTAETRHDFRVWAQTMDWITRNLLDAGPLLDGHRETQARMTTPAMNWLRDVALDVLRSERGGLWLRANTLVDLIADSATETPGLPEHGDLADADVRSNVQRAVGRRLGQCFRGGDLLTLDGMTIERREAYDPEGRFTVREYRFAPAAIDNQPGQAAPLAATAQTIMSDATAAEMPPCGHRRDHPAAIETGIKPQCAANAAMTSLSCQHPAPATEDDDDIFTMGTYGRMAAAGGDG